MTKNLGFAKFVAQYVPKTVLVLRNENFPLVSKNIHAILHLIGQKYLQFSAAYILESAHSITFDTLKVLKTVYKPF